MNEKLESMETQGSGDSQRLLAFTLSQEIYAVPLLKVKEVIAPTEITPVPHTPNHFRGIMNLRGQVISVIDLRLKFKIGKGETSPESAIIILDLSPLSLGVIVDSIDSVLAVRSEEVQPAPTMEIGMRQDFISGVTRKEKRLVLLLDIEKALSVEDLKALRHQAA